MKDPDPAIRHEHFDTVCDRIVLPDRVGRQDTAARFTPDTLDSLVETYTRPELVFARDERRSQTLRRERRLRMGRKCRQQQTAKDDG